MRVGDLVVLNEHSHFTNGIRDIIGVPFNEIGIVIQEKQDICCVIFPLLEGRLRTFMKEDLRVVSSG